MENGKGAVEVMGVARSEFWQGKRVMITGHTGFKGSWLALWLHKLGAEVHGYALEPPTSPSMYEICDIESVVGSTIGNICDYDRLLATVRTVKPEIIFHMAAQPLVRQSYSNPSDTYSTNVMGTVNLMETVRSVAGVRVVINITTDKCYENKEWIWGYRENEALGGHDPYSSSKACSELVTSAYRNSFFPPSAYDKHGVAIATARAGNVIGGGDWAMDRLIPDLVRSYLASIPISIRSPDSIRPWQHVLEPLNGYLLLAQSMFNNGAVYSDAWNFGPYDHDVKTVKWIVEYLCGHWDISYSVEQDQRLHEAKYLKLDSSKARMKLGWSPNWDVERALLEIIEWTRAYQAGESMREYSLSQIAKYENTKEIKS